MTTTAAANVNRNTFNRPDTFLGICEAIGQDFGFNPLWLRLAFVPPVFFAPQYAFIAYAVLGLVVLASRKLFPAKAAAVDTVSAPERMVAAPSQAGPADLHEDRLPLAA